MLPQTSHRQHKPDRDDAIIQFVSEMYAGYNDLMRKIAQAVGYTTAQRGLPSLVPHPVRLASMTPVVSRRTRILTGQTGFDKPEQPWAWSKDCHLLLAGHPLCRAGRRVGSAHPVGTRMVLLIIS